MASGPHRLYVAEFSCGVLKAGITKMRGNKRHASLRFRGAPCSRIHYGEPHNGGYEAEKDLLCRLTRMSNVLHGGREWFTGLRFAVACQITDQVTRANRKAFGAPVVIAPESRISRRGFASMAPELRSQIAAKGGAAVQRSGVGHAFTSDEAREAGRKGGIARVSQLRAVAEAA